MILRFLPALLALGLSLPAEAQRRERIDHEAQYNACLQLLERDPSGAFESANGWFARGGGMGARHCAALALLRLKQYGEAAQRLEKLAADMDGYAPEQRSEVLSQASQAWVFQGNNERAHAVLSSAIKLRPNDVDLWIDRALVLASAKNYFEAMDDLNRAVDLAPRRADALVLRASAWRYLDSLDLAAEDLERALRIDPQFPDALLERGIVRRLKEDVVGARADWLAVTRIAPESPAADLARDNLARLDVKN